MAFTGYNAERVNELRGVINSTAQASSTSIVEILEADIIAKMAEVWYAPEAVTFFGNFATAVAQAGTHLHSAFDQFRLAIQESGVFWAENTGGEAPSLGELDEVKLILNIGAIQEKNAAGDVVIDVDSANTVANSLGDVEAKIKSELESLAQNLDANTAFIGGGQAEALSECFIRVTGEVHKIFSFLTNGGADGTSLQQAITDAGTKYSDVATEIASAANNSTSTTA